MRNGFLPQGLTFSRRAEAFFVLAAANTTPPSVGASKLVMITGAKDPAGAVDLAFDPATPMTMAFDDRRNRLLFYDAPAQRLIAVQANASGLLDPASITH